MTGAKIVFGTIILLNFIVSAFLVSELSGVAHRVEQLALELPSKSDVAMLNPVRIQQTLERNCMSCHTDRRWRNAYGESRSSIKALVWKMRSHPGGDVIPEDEIEQVEAALIAVRCTTCHGEEVVAQLGIMPREARLEYLRGKLMRIKPVYRGDEYYDLIFAFDVLLGEPRRTMAASAR
jgi:hypothetical protein